MKCKTCKTPLDEDEFKTYGKVKIGFCYECGEEFVVG